MMLALSKKYAGWAMHSQTLPLSFFLFQWRPFGEKKEQKNNADDSYFKSKYLWKLLASFVALAIAVLDHNFDPNWNILSEMSRQILG